MTQHGRPVSAVADSGHPSLGLSFFSLQGSFIFHGSYQPPRK
jgi:hypothetical protein